MAEVATIQLQAPSTRTRLFAFVLTVGLPAAGIGIAVALHGQPDCHERERDPRDVREDVTGIGKQRERVAGDAGDELDHEDPDADHQGAGHARRMARRCGR